MKLPSDPNILLLFQKVPLTQQKNRGKKRENEEILFLNLEGSDIHDDQMFDKDFTEVGNLLFVRERRLWLRTAIARTIFVFRSA